MKRILPFLAVAVIGGAAAILIPALVAPQAFVGSIFRGIVERPSVWAFQGLFVVGFMLAVFGKFQWLDLPLVAVAMVALFPMKAGIELTSGSTAIAWPREFYLYAAWLIPAVAGLATGHTIRSVQRRARELEQRRRKGPAKRRPKRRKRR